MDAKTYQTVDGETYFIKEDESMHNATDALLTREVWCNGSFSAVEVMGKIKQALTNKLEARQVITTLSKPFNVCL